LSATFFELAFQRILESASDFSLYDLAARIAARFEMNDVAALAATAERARPARSLHQHLLRRLDQGRQMRLAQRLAQSKQLGEPHALVVFRNFVAELERRRVRTRRVLESEKADEAHTRHELERGREVFGRLARKADDHVGRQGEIGDRAA
jgi:hypothetical protein